MSNERIDRFRDRLRKHLPELNERYGVASLALFGSYVRGEETPESDLDLLVEFREKPGLFGFVELEERLSDLLGVRVDLVLRDALKPRIGERIRAEAIPL